MKLFFLTLLFGINFSSGQSLTVTNANSQESTQYDFFVFMNYDDNERPVGIDGSVYINGNKSLKFEEFLKSYSRASYQALSQYEKEKALEILISYRGLPQHSDPSDSRVFASRQQELLSTEFYTLPRYKQIQIYKDAIKGSFWEEGSDTNTIIRELLKEKDGQNMVGELLCRHSTVYMQKDTFQYGEAEDAEIVAKKFKKIFQSHPKFKSSLCNVHGNQLDLAQIAKSAEDQSRILEAERVQTNNLKQIENLKKMLRESNDTKSCSSANLTRTFSMSVDSLMEASPGVESFISAKFKECVVEGRLGKHPNGQYYFKFGYNPLKGKIMELSDLANEWKLNLNLPKPTLVSPQTIKPSKIPAQQR